MKRVAFLSPYSAPSDSGDSLKNWCGSACKSSGIFAQFQPNFENPLSDFKVVTYMYFMFFMLFMFC